MKKTICILISIVALLAASAQTQQGYVKTKGRLGSNGAVVKGSRLSGATITVKGRNAVVSGANGSFTLALLGNNYFLQSVQKQGYVLTDPDVLSKQYAYSKNPLVLVLESPSQQADDRLAAEKRIRRTLTRQLQEKEDEIEALKEQNRITEEEYRKQLQELYTQQESNDKLVSEMADRYSKMDFDLVDDFNRRISDCIINGRLTEADSLLNTKGDINSRAAVLRQHQEANIKAEQEIKVKQKKLEKSKALTQKELEELAQDCYSKFEIFKLQHQNDSAAYYIEYRARLDSTNIDWQIDAGKFSCIYMADYSKSLAIFNNILESVIVSEGEKSQDAINLYNYLAYIYLEQAKFDLSIANYKHSIEIAKELYGKDNHNVVRSMINLGVTYSSIGNNEDALNIYNLCLANESCNLIDSIRCYINIAGIYQENAENEKALSYYNKAIALNSDPQSDEDYLYLASCYNGMSVLYANMDDFEKSFEYAQKSLLINIQLYGEKHPNIADNYTNQGSSYNKLSKYDDAITYFSKALSLDSVIYGQWHPRVAIDYNNIGYSYKNLGKYETALDCYEKALQINEIYYGRNHSSVGTVLLNIGGIYEDAQDYARALVYDHEALKILKEVLGEDNYKVAYCYNNIGNIYVETHDFLKAEENLKNALAIDLSLYGDDHSSTATTYNNLARMYNEKGDIDNAAKYMEKVSAIMSKIYGEDHVHVAITYYNVSVLHKKRGDYKKALELAERSYQILKKLLPEDHQTVKTIKNGIAEIQEKMK